MKTKLFFIISLSGIVLTTISCSIVKSSLGDLYESLTGNPAPKWAEGTTNHTSFQSANGLSTLNLKEVNQELCPDDKHPHAILMGGGYWACCNVGASRPEEIGDSYSWGETWTKDEHDYFSYERPRYSDDGKYLKDIERSSFDVATVKWGGKWQMPPKDRISELKRNNTFEKVKYKGVIGYLVSFRNNKIFLPIKKDAKYTYYWTSEMNYPDYVGSDLDHWYIYVYCLQLANEEGVYPVEDDCSREASKEGYVRPWYNHMYNPQIP